VTTSTNSNGADRTGAAPRIVHYEPTHTGKQMLRIRAAFERRGYQVTTEYTESANVYVFEYPDGRLGVDLGDVCGPLTPLSEWSSATAYVTGIADYIERISRGAAIEPGAQVIYYEPEHDDGTMKLLRATLAERGYGLAHPDLWYVDAIDVDAAPELKVDLSHDGVQTILYGDTGVTLEPVEAYLVVESYALAIADWFDSDHAVSPEEPEAAQIAEEARTTRAAWIAAIRKLADLAEADPTLPLPDNAFDRITFTTSQEDADRLATHLHQPQEFSRVSSFYNRVIHGTLAGVEVEIIFGTSRTGVRV
jgi:hypothetical protein